jgi:hypothetical protein
VIECERVDRHDHADPRLPESVLEGLRGERRTAPPMRTWQSQRSLEYPSGSSAGLNARRADGGEDEPA